MPKDRYPHYDFSTNRGKDGKGRNLHSHAQTTVFEFKKFISLISSIVQAVLPVRLQLRYLQQQQMQSLNQACSYQEEIVLNSLPKQELLWWVGNLRLNNGRLLRQKEPNLVIQTDASKPGWGAFWYGVSTGGDWSEKEEKLHINVLELIPAKFAILTFIKGQLNIAIHLQIYNKTALSYLLDIGGTHNRELLHISKSIWSYLLSKQIAMSAEYLPSALNVHADWESRNAKDNSEWKLDISVFQEIVTHMRQSTLDLFASSICNQLPQYIAWKPDSGSITPDTFLNPWDREHGFAFPPFSLISQILREILEKKIDHLIIVTPTR